MKKKPNEDAGQRDSTEAVKSKEEMRIKKILRDKFGVSRDPGKRISYDDITLFELEGLLNDPDKFNLSPAETKKLKDLKNIRLMRGKRELNHLNKNYLSDLDTRMKDFDDTNVKKTDEQLRSSADKIYDNTLDLLKKVRKLSEEKQNNITTVLLEKASNLVDIIKDPKAKEIAEKMLKQIETDYSSDEYKQGRKNVDTQGSRSSSFGLFSLLSAIISLALFKFL